VPSEWTAEETGDEIRAEMVNDISRKHYPGCMRNLHDNLRREHHLKYYGRLQYGLFLKVGTIPPINVRRSMVFMQGLGLSIEEALVFWRKSFSKFTDDKFNKEYKYNIRHSYGLEGGRRNYPPKRYTVFAS
jgi:DNA primase large subunit